MLSVYNTDTKLKWIIGEIETSSLKVFVDLYWLYVARWLAGLDGCSIRNSVPSIIALKFSMSLTANTLVISHVRTLSHCLQIWSHTIARVRNGLDSRPEMRQ